MVKYRFARGENGEMIAIDAESGESAGVISEMGSGGAKQLRKEDANNE